MNGIKSARSERQIKLNLNVNSFVNNNSTVGLLKRLSYQSLNKFKTSVGRAQPKETDSSMIRISN